MAADNNELESIVVCVTGACGGVGTSICKLLAEGGHTEKAVKEIRALDLAEPRETSSEDEPRGPTFKYLKGSVLDEAFLREAFAGCDVVIHAASLIDFGNGEHSTSKLFEVNIEGTRRVIRACRAAGVASLVYTSSSTAIARLGPNRDIKSDAPYPAALEEYNAGAYGFSKAAAESLCLAVDKSLATRADDPEPRVLRTCALRLRNVYGEHDRIIVPRFVQAGVDGLLTFKIGDGKALQDNIYVFNAAYGHICAMNALQSGDAPRIEKVAGRAFNLSHEEPKSIYEMVHPFLEAFGVTIPDRHMPVWLMLALAHVVTFIVNLIPKSLRPENAFTPASVKTISEHHTYTDQDALDDLGFKALFSPEEANRRTVNWLLNEWEGRHDAQAKAARDSGNGGRYVAQILLALIIALCAAALLMR